MTLSVIILSWNTRELTRQCLKSIYDNAKDLDYEVIVVENGSSDDSADMVAGEFPQVKLIRNSENLGFTKGNNQGFKDSRGEYILFLNSDTIVPVSENKKSQLCKMIEAMEKDKFIGALTSKLLNPDGSFQWEFYRKIPNLSRTFWVYLAPFNKLTHSIKFLRKRYLVDIDENKSQVLEDANAPGAALLMSREAHKKIRGRDENIFYWMEDVDLWFSLREAGYKLYYLADAEIIHYGAASSAMWDDLRKMLDFRTGYVYVFRKHKGRFQGFIVKWMFILNALLTAPFLLVLGLIKRKYWSKGVVTLKFVWKFMRV